MDNFYRANHGKEYTGTSLSSAFSSMWASYFLSIKNFVMKNVKWNLGVGAVLFVGVLFVLVSQVAVNSQSQLAQVAASSNAVLSGVCGKPNENNPDTLDFTSGVVLLSGNKYSVPKTLGLFHESISSHTDFYAVKYGRGVKVEGFNTAGPWSGRKPDAKYPSVKIATGKWNRDVFEGITHKNKSCTDWPAPSITVLSPNGGEMYSNSLTERIPLNLKWNGGEQISSFLAFSDGTLCPLGLGSAELGRKTLLSLRIYSSGEPNGHPYPNGVPCTSLNPPRFIVPGKYKVILKLHGYDGPADGRGPGTVVAEDSSDSYFTITK